MCTIGLFFILSVLLGQLFFFMYFLKISFYLTYLISTAKSSPVAGSTLHTAHCTLHTAHCSLHSIHWTLYLQLHLYTSYYTLNMVHCTPYIYLTCCTSITSHCKRPKFAWVALKIYMTQMNLNLPPQAPLYEANFKIFAFPKPLVWG